MIRRLLIANRGEIAVRIARTAHRLGIDTVGVYSQPDADALHVDVVDIAVALGGVTPAESYLNAEAVIRAALDSGCDAVHPGYGFLAENAGFAGQVQEAGLIWVGPTPEQISLLGDKVTAKKMAIEAGVPTGPVFAAAPGSIPDGVPMPALVKAAAGGGGRGMRVVRSPDELAAAVDAASREAASAFGDGTVFIEPYIERGRHVEVQIIGDTHGSVVHLGERECSIQRRNQKILEESPSPGIDADVRQALWNGALALANHVGYQNAGTVEFLVADDGTINFLEVNTRLQVEHPVTEAVTGLDLVELQLRVAAGELLPLTQDEVSFHGHAIEARIVAEDPARDWIPSTGTLIAFDMGDHVRVDTGVRSGTAITPDYDSLLAKVIGHAGDRSGAIRQLERALRTSRIVGVQTNTDALIAILGESDFLAAATPTAYLDEHPDVPTSGGPGGEDRLALLLGAIFASEARDRATNPGLAFAPPGWRNLRTMGEREVWLDGETAHHIETVFDGPNEVRAWVGPWPTPLEDGSLPPDERRVCQVRLINRNEHRVAMSVDGVRRVIDVILDGSSAHTSSPAGSRSWRLAPRFIEHGVEEAGSGPMCPLPGTVVAVHVERGQTVAAGDLLMVVEAMKMEHKITAGADAVATEVLFGVGDRVDAGDLLVRLDHIE